MPDLSPGFSTDQPTRTGTCPVCGREAVPVTSGRILAAHNEQHVRGRRGGLPIYVDTDTRCDGTGQPPEPGTETRPTTTRPAKPRRNQNQRQDSAA